MSSCDFAAIGSIIALFGLLFNNIQANHRETRKEILSKINTLNLSLTALLDYSKNYYLDDHAIMAREIVKIHESFNICGRLITELKELKKGINLESDFYIIFDMVTGGDFESMKHRPGNHHTEHCKKISIQKEALVTKAEHWFNKTFR